MQLSSEIKPYWLRTPGAEVIRLSPVNSLPLVFALAAIVLAFVPLVPPVEALQGGMTTRGVIEFGLILTALGLLAIYLKAQGAFSFEVKTPAFLVISAFCWWSMVSAIWSYNPVLTMAKAAELWCIALAALMIATLAVRSRFAEGKLETLLALSTIAVIAGLILANLFYWGKLLPSTGDETLPLEIFGEEVTLERPRLLLVFQHALSTADLLAVAIISLFVSDLRKIFKALLFPGLFALLWLTDARGPTVALAAAMLAIAILKLRRNSVRAIAVMLSGSFILAGLLAFQDRLPAIVKPFVSDDLYTLNSRTDLWAQTLSHIATQPILGTGYFASRYVLIKDFSWAGHAHNSFLEVQLTTGIVGLAVLVTFLIVIFKDILTSRNAWLLGLTLYCLIQGMLNPVLFNPGLAMFGLTLALLYQALKKSSASPAMVNR